MFADAAENEDAWEKNGKESKNWDGRRKKQRKAGLPEFADHKMREKQ